MPVLLPPDDVAGLPLASIDAVALDLETTGLNVESDRVIEVGAVQIASGQLKPDSSYSRFVNPNRPIPESSREIHGISDDDVAGAAEFRVVFEEFGAWAGPRLYLGYSFWFDLGMLQAECSRSNLIWQKPRSLDVEELVRALNPMLPNTSLGTVTSWLGIETTDRHRALGDASMTARVFLQLIPKLRMAGIASVAQAERACRRARHLAVAERRDPQPVAASVESVDNFIYRQRVQDVMSRHVLIVEPTASVSETIDRLVSSKAGSVLVGRDTTCCQGILTEKDLVRAFSSDKDKALSRPIEEYYSRPLLNIHRKDFVYRAIVSMRRHKVRHLAVVDDDRVVGVVSARDVFASYSDDAAGFGQEIVAANSTAELGRVWLGLTTVVRSLSSGNVDARTITAVVSRELRALTERACVLAERKMRAEGRYVPDTGYAMLVLGSGGRGESLLAMDQDNAIVHVENDEDNVKDRFLADLGREVATMLDEVGVKLCDGGVMACNREWRKDAAEWRRTVRHWVSRSSPKDLLSADIFFDAMPVHGNIRLANEVRSSAMAAAKGSRTFLSLLSVQAADFNAPRGFLGRWKLERRRIDLKMGGIMPILSAARVLALKHGLKSRSTAHRLFAYRNLNISPARKVEDVVAAHGMLLGLILQQQLRDIENGLAPSNRVAPGELDAFGRQQLEWAVDQLRIIPDLLGTPTPI